MTGLHPGAAQTGGSADRGATPYAYTNRLIDSNDPYLLLHAHNPVDWYPWGEEALERARREDKPIFLSVGYSTCFWCHVAERLIYSDPKIAALMNQWFVNIKVDREQRPDLDRMYMLATEVMTGQGGWPNNVFLTPDLKPFFAGSYFPPQDADGRPGFTGILQALHESWTSDRVRIDAQADRVFQAMQQAAQGEVVVGTAPVAVSPRRWLADAAQDVQSAFDDRNGGFGRSDTKFPQAPLLALLLAHRQRSGEIRDARVLRKTLDEMALGGIFDQLAGGFHRYSTDPTWSVPHFEKMLYDSAQLLQIYAEAYRQFGDPLYRYVAEATARYLLREMRAGDGSFYTAQDAEVGGLEGASYVWTEPQIKALLGADAKPFLTLYSLTPLPPSLVDTGTAATLPPGAGVLRLNRDFGSPSSDTDHQRLFQRIESQTPVRARLLQARQRRPQPLLDAKQVVSLNALAILAFEHSAGPLDRKEFAQVAEQAANAVWSGTYDATSGRLSHEIFRGRPQIPAYLDDYALFGLALLAIHQRSGEKIWLDRSVKLADRILSDFLRANGRLVSSAAAAPLPIDSFDSGDDIQPSGTSAAIALLLELGRITGEPRFGNGGRVALAHVAPLVAAHPMGWPSLITELASYSPDQDVQTARANLPAGPPSSADVVKVSAQRAGQGRIVVTLTIESGYHINANTASLDYLVPTTVTLDSQRNAKVRYPTAEAFRPQFVGQDLRVYQGTVQIEVEPPAAGPGDAIEGEVKAQACTAQICLLPSTIRFSVEH